MFPTFRSWSFADDIAMASDTNQHCIAPCVIVSDVLFYERNQKCVEGLASPGTHALAAGCYEQRAAPYTGSKFSLGNIFQVS